MTDNTEPTGGTPVCRAGVVEKGLVVVVLLGVVAHLAAVRVPVPGTQGVLFAYAWPDFGLAGRRMLLELAGFAGLIAAFVIPMRLRVPPGRSYWLVMLGVAVVSFVGGFMPGPVGAWGHLGARVFITLLALALLSVRRLGSPVLAAGALALAAAPLFLLPHPAWIVGAIVAGGGAGVFVAWLVLRVFDLRSRAAAAVVLVLGVIAGSVAGLVEILPNRQSWYGYHISLDVLEFGDIDGDGQVDLLTYGYHGMVAGNPTWFRGRGRRFDDWSEDHEFRDLAQTWVHLADLDADGDPDVVGADRVLINDHGTFTTVESPYTAGNDEAARLLEEGAWRMANVHWWNLDVSTGDLNSDGLPEIVASYNGTLVLGVARGNHRWEFHCFEDLAHFSIDDSRPDRVTLVVRDPSRELRALMTKEHLRFREIGPIPVEPPERTTYTRFAWRDLDGDGSVELIVWHDVEGEGPGERITHFGGMGTFPPTVSEIAVCRERDGGFNVLSRFSTESFIDAVEHAPPEAYRFVDFDGDGRLDFLGDDGYIYRQGPDLRFEPRIRVKLRNGDRRARLYAVDVNGDGRPDVVSSYQPFWNLRLGPFWKD
ncbi:MAG TPA: VCBS repeat-containing protein [Planctomycetota bacterium]|nr:VCBS repeat-containing protein [Planctomycetota bacterium]